jgi:hypothetical protein
MANQINTTLVIHNYTYDLDAGDVLYFRLDNIITSQILEIQFLENSTVNVYDCINDFTVVKDAFDGAEQSELDALNWIAWSLGEITQASDDKRLVGSAPVAFKVHNSGSGQVRVNYKGLRG